MRVYGLPRMVNKLSLNFRVGKIGSIAARRNLHVHVQVEVQKGSMALTISSRRITSISQRNLHSPPHLMEIVLDYAAAQTVTVLRGHLALLLDCHCKLKTLTHIYLPLSTLSFASWLRHLTLLFSCRLVLPADSRFDNKLSLSVDNRCYVASGGPLNLVTQLSTLAEHRW